MKMKDVCSADRMSWNLSNPSLRRCHNTLRASYASHQINNFLITSKQSGSKRVGAVPCPQSAFQRCY